MELVEEFKEACNVMEGSFYHDEESPSCRLGEQKELVLDKEEDRVREMRYAEHGKAAFHWISPVTKIHSSEEPERTMTIESEDTTVIYNRKAVVDAVLKRQ